MEANAENVQPMQNSVAVQILENNGDISFNNLSQSVNTENWLNNVFVKTHEENKNELQKDIQSERSLLQLKIDNATCKVQETKLKSKSIKSNTSHSDKTKNIEVLMNENTESADSSSDEEILQTRFSFLNKSTFKADEYRSNDCSSIMLSKSSVLESNLNPKIHPIIHEKAYDEDNIANDSNNITLISKMEQTEKTDLKEANVEITSRDSLNVETNTCIGSNSIQNSNENSNEQFDIKDCFENTGNNEVSLQQLMDNITVIAEQGSSSIELEKSKIAYDDSIVDDFLNGTFDVNAYKLKNCSSVENYKAPILSNTERFDRNKSTSTLQTNAKRIHENNTYIKKELNELVMTNKGTKKNSNKNELFQNSFNAPTTGLKRKKLDGRQIKKIQKVQMEAKKSNKKSVCKKSKNSGEFSLKAEEKLSNISQQRNHINNNRLSNNEGQFFNKFLSSPDEIFPIKANTSRNKCKDNISDTHNNSSLLKRSTRKVRNSSLIASKKIKEIEKFENLTDSCDEIIGNSDDVNFTSTPYNSEIILNSFQVGKACTNRTKVKHDNISNMLNIDENELQAEKIFDSKDIVQFYFRGDKMKNKKLRRNTKKRTENLRNPFNAFSSNMQSTLKGGTYKSRDLTSNLFNENFTEESDDLQSSLKEESILNNNTYTLNKNVCGNNIQNLLGLTEATKENKHRTWDILERDLLEELDDIPLTDVCKTVILKGKEIVKKKTIIKDTNLLTVSNASMLHTISKSKRGKYNMQCEIKNTEKKSLESKDGNTYNFLDKSHIPQSKQIIHSNCKNINILERTIAAMDKCVTKFIEPQVRTCDYEQKDSGLQFEDTSDNSDTNHETQFHSITFLAEDNKQYYSNEIVGYMKKSNRKGKRSINFKQKSNMSKILSDSRSQQKESDYENFEHSDQSVTARKNYLFENSPGKSSYTRTSQALVSNIEEKDINPWNKLMNKLNYGAYYEEGTYPVDNSKTEEKIKQYNESLMINKNLKPNLSNSKRNAKILFPVDFEVEGVNEQEVLTLMQSEETESLVNYTTKSKDLHFVDSSTLRDTGFKCHTDKKKNTRENGENEKSDRKSEKPVKKKNCTTKVTKKQILCKPKNKTNIKKSPKYELKIARDGALKLKMHSSSSSLETNSSKDFVKSKNIVPDDLKNNGCSNYKTNKAKEKYKKYLKNLFEKQDLLFKKEEIGTQPKEVEAKEITEKNSVQGKNSNPRIITKMKLIAENDNDIFSLSSGSESADTL